MNRDELSNDKFSIFFVLIILVGSLISAYEYIHRNDDDIELCMSKRLSDYLNYRKCKHTNSCEIYDYDKRLCTQQVEYEKKLANH